jgi:hypothetical protein
MTRRILGPALARTSESGDRTYTWDFPWPDFVPGPVRREFYSVTTLLSGGMPKWLHAHYAKMVAELVWTDMSEHDRRSARTMLREWASRGLTWISDLQEGGDLTSIDRAIDMTEDELGLRYLKGAAPRHRDYAGDRGSAVHAEAEDLIVDLISDLIRSGDTNADGRLFIPPDRIPKYEPWIAPRMDNFVRWVNDFGPRYLYTEASVFSHLGYAGTSDAGIEIPVDGKWVSICTDYKSGDKAVYPEVALQTEAYRRADWIGLPDGQAIPMPKMDRTAVLWLTDKDYTFKWLNRLPDGTDVSDEVFALFLNVCEVARFHLASPLHPRGLSARVIGERIMPDLSDSLKRSVR